MNDAIKIMPGVRVQVGHRTGIVRWSDGNGKLLVTFTDWSDEDMPVKQEQVTEVLGYA